MTSAPPELALAIQPTPTLADTMSTILDSSSPTMVIVCMPRQRFLEALVASMRAQEHPQSHDEAAPPSSQPNLENLLSATDPCQHTDNAQTTSPSPQEKHPLLSRTLRTIAAAQRVKLAFVPSVPALHAYLAAFQAPEFPAGLPASRPATSGSGSAAGAVPQRRGEEVPAKLVLLGMAALHRETASFSAQGLGRACAAAVETGWSAGMRVVFLECVRENVEGSREDPGTQGVGLDADVEMNEGEEAEGPVDSGQRGDDGENWEWDAWEEEIPMLNATTKTFGNLNVGSGRGFLGKTVKVKDVLARWCTFGSLDELSANW